VLIYSYLLYILNAEDNVMRLKHKLVDYYRIPIRFKTTDMLRVDHFDSHRVLCRPDQWRYSLLTRVNKVQGPTGARGPKSVLRFLYVGAVCRRRPTMLLLTLHTKFSVPPLSGCRRAVVPGRGSPASKAPSLSMSKGPRLICDTTGLRSTKFLSQ